MFCLLIFLYSTLAVFMLPLPCFGVLYALSVLVGLVQVLANGFVVGPHSYLHSSWNIMDGSLVMLSLFDVGVSLSAAQGQRHSLGILRVFRLLRTLRPLRSVFVVRCSFTPGL